MPLNNGEVIVDGVLMSKCNVKIDIVIKGNVDKYLVTAPQGAEMLEQGMEILGTVTTKSGAGALVRLKKRYYRVNGDAKELLDGRAVAGALGKYGHGGRPKVIDGGKAVKVRLDAASIDRARKLGNGNVSKGIRLALRGAS